MISSFQKILLTFFISSLFSACYFSEASKKKHVRENWYEYFLAFTSSPDDTLRFGTKNMFVDFQNHSDYKVDSVAFDFENRGLLIDSHDTLWTTNVAPKAKIGLRVPRHYWECLSRRKLFFCVRVIWNFVSRRIRWRKKEMILITASKGEITDDTDLRMYRFLRMRFGFVRAKKLYCTEEN